MFSPAAFSVVGTCVFVDGSGTYHFCLVTVSDGSNVHALCRRWGGWLLMVAEFVGDGASDRGGPRGEQGAQHLSGFPR